MKIVMISAAMLSAMALVLVGRALAQQTPKDVTAAPPFTSVPTFSTANIARQGHFYVGGKWVGKPGQEWALLGLAEVLEGMPGFGFQRPGGLD